MLLTAEQEKIYKERFHEASSKKRDYKSNEYYSFDQLVALKDMACLNIYPDGNFGDTDCLVWSMFRSAARNIDQ